MAPVRLVRARDGHEWARDDNSGHTCLQGYYEGQAPQFTAPDLQPVGDSDSALASRHGLRDINRLGGRGIDNRRDLEHAIGRESSLPGVFPDDLSVRRDVDAGDLVLRNVALDPLNAGAEPLEDRA